MIALPTCRQRHCPETSEARKQVPRTDLLVARLIPIVITLLIVPDIWKGSRG